MGMPRQLAHIILEEHKHKAIVGDVLLCGRQTIYLGIDESKQFIQQRGVALREGVEPRVDDVTRAGRGNDLISDISFFELFTDARFHAVDLTDYEKATIIHDMCKAIPQDLASRFSFIYNGSCMDNLANPAQFLVNTSEMLRPGGVVIHLEHGTPVCGAYVMFSPDFFFDFYAVNNYADCKVYVAQFEGDLHKSHWNLLHWDPLMIQQNTIYYMQSFLRTKADLLIITIAEKGTDSTDIIFPTQAQYRPAVQARTYVESALRFRQSKRPILNSGCYRPIEPNNFPRVCGSF
jgi:SAM-dependent methyltransferase